MARRPRRRTSPIPRPLQPLVGSVVLVVAVRAIDLVWTRMTGARPPSRTTGDEPTGSTAAGSDPNADGAPSVVRDRLLYALLLSGALRLAQRAGLRDTKVEGGTGGANAGTTSATTSGTTEAADGV